jgi:hypothetical protein
VDCAPGGAAGLEGSGLTAFVQYPELSGLFELRCINDVIYNVGPSIMI